MALDVSLQINKRQQRQVQRLLASVPVGMPKVMQRALRRTGDMVRVRIVRAVAGNINIAQNKLFQRGNKQRPITQPVRATVSNPSERIEVSGGRLPLGRFGAKQHWRKGRSGGRLRKFVSYRIDKTGGRQRVEGAFIPDLGSGFRGVFKRKGRARHPLVQLFGPSVPQVAQTRPQVMALIRTDAADLLEKNVAQQVQRVLDKGRR